MACIANEGGPSNTALPVGNDNIHFGENDTKYVRTNQAVPGSITSFLLNQGVADWKTRQDVWAILCTEEISKGTPESRFMSAP